MGDIIRKVGEISLGDKQYEIELNHSIRGINSRDVHIQNEKFRLEMPEHEFLKMAACVLLAKKQYDVLKGKIIDE